MEKLKENLTKAGLTGNESKLYLELLKNQELTANELSKKVSMDRTLAYSVLNHLIEKGLISYIIKQNKKFFKAEKPANLLNKLKEKEIFVKDLISELNKIQKEIIIPYEIKIFEGKEGLRNLMNLIIQQKEFFSFGGTGKAFDLLYEMGGILQKMNKNKFSGKIIFSERYKEHKLSESKLIQKRYLKLESEATTTIFGEYVSIHLAKEKPLVILIKNKEIVKSYRNHFEELWKNAIQKNR